MVLMQYSSLNNKNRLVLAILLFLLAFNPVFGGTPDTLNFGIAFRYFNKAKTCYKSSPSGETCAGLLRQAYDLSGNHAYFLEQIVAYLITTGKYDEARKYIYIQRTDTLSNSLQARHSHFKGILELRSGFNHFSEAFQSFKEAYRYELRSEYPSFRFLSQVQNAIGYTKMIYGGPNKGDPKDNPHCNWITADLIDALRNFEQALYFDDKNENARANRDTLFSIISQSGQEVDEIKDQIKALPIEVLRNQYVVKVKTKNDTLREVDVNYLPNNKNILLNILQKYDELLLVADISGSMKDIHTKKGVSRFRLLKELVLFLFHSLRNQTKTGIVSVGRGCTNPPDLFFPTELNARKDIMDKFESIGPLGSTPLSFSITEGKQLYTAKDNKKALFLISDGMETCGNPLDLCIIAGDLHAIGIDLHIMSFIVEGMEDAEFAYEIYHCMTEYSNGRVFQYEEEVPPERPPEPETLHEEILLLPPIKFGKNLRDIVHFTVDLTNYFRN